MRNTVGMNPFVERQRDPRGGTTHWTISDEELLQRVRDNWDRRRKGYRSGVVLVPIDPTGFLAAMRILQDGDRLKGAFRPRRPGETPRKGVGYDSPIPMEEAKVTPVSVDIVLYHKRVLAKDGEVVQYTWNVIAVLGKFCPADEDEPMPPETLMANHFGADGGTPTKMSPKKFEAALRKSFEYWGNKALYS